MPTRTAVQVVCLTALVAVGTMLLLVGAFGSGGLCLAGSAFCFWRLYRDTA
ncbi:MAG: hypothetical protein GX610_23050 [Rhodococcus sp.]|nr:hypothetical protein [Rhodococcus sp. (in: high G+C Gram-positive bacteria)]